jgi:hypothetical protein
MYRFTVEALTGAGWSAASEPSNPVTPRADAGPSVTITGTREGKRIAVSGQTTGFGMGGTLCPWVRVAGQSAYTRGSATILVSMDGTFEWGRTRRCIRQDKQCRGDDGNAQDQRRASVDGDHTTSMDLIAGRWASRRKPDIRLSRDFHWCACGQRGAPARKKCAVPCDSATLPGRERPMVCRNGERGPHEAGLDGLCRIKCSCYHHGAPRISRGPLARTDHVAH